MGGNDDCKHLDACGSSTGEDKSKALRSAKNSFNRNLLKTLCKLEWGTTIEEVSEERIRSELANIIGDVRNADIIDIDALFDQVLKMNLREHGLSSTFSNLNRIKEKFKFLKQYLEPAALRDAIDTHHRLVDSSSKTDDGKQVNVARMVRNGTKEQRNGVCERKIGANPDWQRQEQTENRLLSLWEDHWLSQCPDLDEAAKETLLAELDIRLTLNTAAGPERCQDPKRCLIVESDEDEMLEGKTLLSELDIDIEQQLAYLASRGTDDDASFSEPNGMPPCKASVM
ncbi:hypothetical protein GN958_ATG20221 [Phytophthora infestans]|uniref:Uncharacterized protein n=1 Tax=Phytophthora infestans TaxID=4787 RepID=A0A8S9TV09_PHYIN|nr:hypothetical protein GN958_ATG20221 [Phytophthora infestans]